VTREGRERSKGRTTSPSKVFSVWACNNLNSDIFWDSGFNFLKNSVTNTLKHGSTTRENDILVKIKSCIFIAILDWLADNFLDGRMFISVNLKWLEEILGAFESLVTKGDDFTARQLIFLLKLGAILRLLQVLSVILRNIAKIFFDVSHNFKFSWWGKLDGSLQKKLLQ
jgi:hypothetical protein